MDKDLIVIAGATHREGFLDEYETQLACADIRFHLEPLTNLPGGANSITMRRRIDYIRAMADNFSDYAHIIMTDAWDVLFLGTKEDLLNKVGDGVEISAERNCYPEPHLRQPILNHYGCDPLPWSFANNGMLFGSPAKLLELCDAASKFGDLDILDQAWFNRRLVEDRADLFSLDVLTDVFYVVSSTQEGGQLRMKNGRPWNSLCDSFPCFFHFSGKCPDDRFRALLRGEIDAL